MKPESKNKLKGSGTEAYVNLYSPKVLYDGGRRGSFCSDHTGCDSYSRGHNSKQPRKSRSMQAGTKLSLKSSKDRTEESRQGKPEKLPIIVDGWRSLQKHKETNGIMIRPIAFKPVHTSSTTSEYCNTPVSCHTPRSCDDGYGTHELSRARSHSTSIKSDVGSDIYASPVRPRTLTGDNVHKVAPSKTAPITVEEYENMLREKEAEMQRVRETMELNENAILKVQERKRIDWENQMRDLSQEYHRHLRLNQEQSSAREIDLQNEISRLESENTQLVNDLTLYNSNTYDHRELSEQLDTIQKRNYELSQKLSHSHCECASLKNKAKELDMQNAQLFKKLEAGKTEQKHLEKSILDLQQQLSSTSHGNKVRLEQLERQIKDRDQQLVEDQQLFELEREKWNEEKVKVLQYQKQLQQTYVQMYRRNTELERQLCRISARQNSIRQRKGRESVTSANTQSSDLNSILNMELDSNPESFC